MSEKNLFVVDKFQKYLKDEMDTIEIVDEESHENKKPLKIPKITKKEQIYWICESCGISNPYFLCKCKNCRQERPLCLYQNYDDVNLLQNVNSIKKSISHVVTEYWQSAQIIASKMGIKQEKDLIELQKKLKYLTKVNYLVPDSTGTKYKLNTFEINDP